VVSKVSFSKLTLEFWKSDDGAAFQTILGNVLANRLTVLASQITFVAAESRRSNGLTVQISINLGSADAQGEYRTDAAAIATELTNFYAGDFVSELQDASGVDVGDFAVVQPATVQTGDTVAATSSSSGLGAGAIAAIVIASVVFCACLGVLGYYFANRNPKPKDTSTIHVFANKLTNNEQLDAVMPNSPDLEGSRYTADALESKNHVPSGL